MAEIEAVALDLGATSGRVVLGRIGPDRLEVSEVSRFANGGVRLLGALHWDVLGIYRNFLDGLRRAAAMARPASIGIDSWAVDFGMLDAEGALVANPLHYRDARFAPVMAEVLGELGAEALYRRSGIQLQAFNTLFQLVEAKRSGRLDRAATMLMIPDLLSYWLCGNAAIERTNASTTQLLGMDGEWDGELIAELGLPRSLFPALVDPGTSHGGLSEAVAQETGLELTTSVTAVCSHDTASAVVAVPASDDRFAYISAGTWSLVGLELEAPVRSEESRAANFTNERGIDDTVRFLRNVTGFYLLEACLREWSRQANAPIGVESLLAEAARCEGRRTVIDVDEADLLGPLGVPGEIAQICRRRGLPAPTTPAEVTRCLLDSLAAAYARHLGVAARLADREITTVHLVGGGARNEVLAQLTADATGLAVVAGPVEAAATGNLLVQARALGALHGDRAELRRLVREQVPTTTFAPRPSETRAWRATLSLLAGEQTVVV